MKIIKLHKEKTNLLRLVALEKPAGRRKLGILAGKMVVPDDFDAPLPFELLSSFEAA